MRRVEMTRKERKMGGRRFIAYVLAAMLAYMAAPAGMTVHASRGGNVAASAVTSVGSAASSATASAVSADSAKPAAGENEAVTMKLTKAQGAVDILNSSDRGLPLRENMRLYNGYQIHTGEESYAWVSLDNAKLAQMDAVSSASLRKRGKKLEILLNSGKVFFNVSEPLADDESLNIRTSTIAVGIRGTSGWVEVIDGGKMQVSVLEGSVMVRVTDPATNEIKEGRVSGGKTAACEVGERGVLFEISGIKEEDVRGFVLSAVAEDPSLAEKIYSGSGLDLRGVTAKEAQEKLAEEAQEMRGRLAQVEAAVRRQEAASTVNLVWGGGRENPGQTTAQGQTAAPALTQGIAPAPGNAQAVPAAPNPNQGAGADDGADSDEDAGSDSGSVVGPGSESGSDAVPGSGFTCTYDSGSKTLTVSGSGRMPAYLNFSNRPWNPYQSEAQSIVVQDGITHIGENAFFGFSNVRSVTLPGSVKSIGDNAFNSCRQADIVIPEGVTDIGVGAFYMTKKQGSLTIPQSVTSIGERAFGFCELTEVLVSAGNTAFASVNGILFSADKTKLVIFPRSRTDTQYTIPNGVTYIEGGAFGDCGNLTEITFSPSVASLGNDVFTNCSALQTFSVSAGNMAFSTDDGILFSYDKSKLVRFPLGKAVNGYEIPAGVTSIAERAFVGCHNLAGSVKIPEGVTSIAANLFFGCRLTQIEIPASVTSIDSEVFEEAYYLETISVSAGNVTYSSDDGVLFSKDKTTLVHFPPNKAGTGYTIPASVTRIGEKAFKDCRNLGVSLTIPEGVRSIDRHAFSSCVSLTEVTIPASVTSIGYGAFGDCTSLQTVKFNGTQSAWDAMKVNQNLFNNLSPEPTVNCTGGP